MDEALKGEIEALWERRTELTSASGGRAREAVDSFVRSRQAAA